MRNEKLSTHVRALIFLVILFVCGNAYPESASLDTSVPARTVPTLDDAWKFFGGYNQNYKRIDETVAMTEEILKRDPDNVPALIFLSRVWLTYGYVKARTREDLIRVFENGKEAAKKAIEIDPRNADAHFFYVANLASLGDTKGLFNSLFMLPEVRREL
ncbi:MAG TPA: hypothetical protein VFJ67_08355, partial [Thermodesulfobacteriota bacterium]|nr:hypothetical protein [Thermodesulfobacteriota bacterium]